MNFEQFKEELDLYFGQTELPEHLTAKIASDEECRRYFEEQAKLASTLGDEADFYPGPLKRKKWPFKDFPFLFNALIFITKKLKLCFYVTAC